MDQHCKDLIARGDKLFSARSSLLSFWQASAELFYPIRANFTSDLTWGESFASHLMESSPPLFHRDLSNAFSSMMRPRGTPWFKLSLEDEDLRQQKDVADWLEKNTTSMRKAIYSHRAQFVTATKEADHDFALIGNCVLSVEVRNDRTGLIYHCHHPRDCAWALNQENEVDTIFRNFEWPARVIRQRWGDKVHANIKKACEKDPEKIFKLRHMMLPREDYEYRDGRKMVGPVKNARFVSIYVDRDHNEILSEEPSFEFRYVCPRWQTIPGSQYGFSPAALISLPDARGIQIMARVLLEAGEKAVDPPVVVTSETIIGEVNMYSGGKTWVDKAYDETLGAAIRPLETNVKNLAIGVDLLNRTQFQLKDAWYLTKLSLPQQGDKTAYETQQLVEEFIRSSIPLFEPMETNYNSRVLDMSAQIMARMGGFGDLRDMPPAMRGKELIYSYSNPLQEAIEKNKVYQAQTTVGVVAAASQFDSTVTQDIDWRSLTRDAVEGSGAPVAWLVDKDEADENIAALGEKAKLAEGINTIGAGAQAAEQVGKAGAALSAVAA